MDVDGTLTDGKIYIGNEGELFKAFDIKDGYALYDILPRKGIIPVVITARKSPMVEHRCKELGVTELWQGEHDKLKKLNEILSAYSTEEIMYDLSNVAYVGDDILDLKVMQPVHIAGGVVACPSNAIKEIRTIADFVSELKAGEGAVREIAEWLVTEDEDSGIDERIAYAVSYLKKLDFTSIENGVYQVNDNFYYTVKDYRTILDEEVKAESHKRFADIQWIIDGRAKIAFQDENRSLVQEQYSEKRDVTIWNRSVKNLEVKLEAGSYCVIKQGEIHIPMIAVDVSENIRIVVGKVR